MDRNALMAGYQSRGGVLDTLDLPPVQPAPSNSLMQALTDYAGRGLGVVDHWAMGIPSTMAGLVNSAIPGQPMGDLWSAKSAAEDARSAVAQSGYADLLALPDAFMGAMPGAAPMAPVAARMAPPAARQAGRLAESAIDPVYNAMPSNAVGSAGGKLTPPPGKLWYRGDMEPIRQPEVGHGDFDGVFLTSSRDKAASYGDNVSSYNFDGNIKRVDVGENFYDDLGPSYVNRINQMIADAKREGADALHLVNPNIGDELIAFDGRKLQAPSSTPPQGITAYHGSPHDPLSVDELLSMMNWKPR